MNAKKTTAKKALNARSGAAQKTTPAKKTTGRKATPAAAATREVVREYVYSHGSAKDKANTLIAAVKERGGTARLHANGDAVRVTFRVGDSKGQMTWETNGAFRYGDESTLDGVKVRNASAALRAVSEL